MKKLISFLLLFWAGIIAAFAYEVLVLSTGQIVQSDTIPSVRKTEVKDDFRITVTYEFDSVQIVRDPLKPTRFHLQPDGFGISETIEFPAIPVKMDQYVVGADYACYLESYQTTDVELDFEYTPASLPQVDGGEEDPAEFPILLFDKFLPEVPVLDAGTQIYRGNTIIKIALTPVQYNSQTKKVRIHKQLSYTIVRIKADAFSASGNAIIYDEPIINRRWDDNELELINEAVAADRSYLILTNAKLKPAAEKLVSWKKTCGYNCHIATSESWTPASVKDSIQSHYNADPSLYYLLIMGDNTIVPGCTGKHPTIWRPLYDNLPYYTDFPYACLDGINDLTADLCVGRMPFSSLQDMNAVVEKTINYESDPSFGKAAAKATFAAQFQELGTTGIEDRGFVYNIERARFYASSWMNHKCSRIYSADDNCFPQRWSEQYGDGKEIPHYLQKPNFAWNGSTQDIVNEFNNGVNLVVHRDHGSVLGWGTPSFKTSDFSKLSNSVLPVVLSLNCQTGTYYASNNFAKGLLGLSNNRGCAAIIGATNLSSTEHNDAFLLGMMNGLWPNPGICHRTTQKEPHNYRTYNAVSSIGEMMNQGLRQMDETMLGSYYFYHGTLDRFAEFQREIYHCLGDPGLNVYWDSETNLADYMKRADYRQGIELSGTRSMTIAIYDSIADKSIRVYGNHYFYDTRDCAHTRVTLFLPGCKQVELPCTLTPIVRPTDPPIIIKGTITDNQLIIRLQSEDNNEDLQFAGENLVVTFGDGAKSVIPLIDGQTEYAVDLSNKTAYTPGDFYVVTIENLNTVIQTQKIRK